MNVIGATHQLDTFEEIAQSRFAGHDLRVLSERAGQTPFFAYDRQRIATRVAAVRRALPMGVHLLYSIKANPWTPLVHHLKGLVDGFDVSSASELRAALDAGAAPADITFAGPGKRDEELRLAAAVGAVVSLESASEFLRFNTIADDLNVSPPVLLRVNPALNDLQGAALRMGGAARQFGVDEGECVPLLRRISGSRLNFQGFHIFWGSQCLRADTIAGAHAYSLEMVQALSDDAGVVPRRVNLGGGFGIPYSAKDSPLDLAAVGAGLATKLANFERRRQGTQVIIELGRYLVGEAGIYVCRVLDRKVSRDETFLVVDGGMHHQLAASGNLGQRLPRNYPLALAGKAPSDEAEQVHIAGCLCTSIDFLARSAKLPRAEVGDFIVIAQSGAYGLTASPTGFLSHPRPPELLV